VNLTLRPDDELATKVPVALRKQPGQLEIASYAAPGRPDRL